MDAAYENAIKRKTKLKQELAEIENFLKLFRRFSGATIEAAGSSEPQPMNGSSESDLKRRTNPAEFADQAAAVLEEAGKPMSRTALAEALEKKGVILPSEDKARYLGTILWRNQNRFTNINGKGYWLKGVENAEAGYFPEADEGSGEPVPPMPFEPPPDDALKDLES